jgi:plasmid maintenance system antidote protein VapI
MSLFTEFIDTCFDGSQAKALGVSRSMVSRIASGDRGISPELALRIERVSQGRYLKERFIWPEAQDAA